MERIQVLYYLAKALSVAVFLRWKNTILASIQALKLFGKRRWMWSGPDCQVTQVSVERWGVVMEDKVGGRSCLHWFSIACGY